MSEARPGKFAHLPFLPAGIAPPYTPDYPLYKGSFFQGRTEESFMNKFWRVKTFEIYTGSPIVFTQDGFSFTTYLDAAPGTILISPGQQIDVGTPGWLSIDDIFCNFRRTYGEFDGEPTYGGENAKVKTEMAAIGDYTGDDRFNIQSSRLSIGDHALLDLDNYISTEATDFPLVAGTPIKLRFDPDGDNIIRPMFARDLVPEGFPDFAWSGGPFYMKPYRYWTWGGQFDETTGARVSAAQLLRTMSSQI